jgi:hypothetical protein
MLPILIMIGNIWLQAKQVGVDALVLIGFVESRFDELIQTHQQLQYWENVPALIWHLACIHFISNNISQNIYSDLSKSYSSMTVWL